ncbi:response regulator [Sneathiella sp.]|jgi:DNA-binding NarL/FixJ family response regulator|uniref:response regulator n=1 Tax=Sneathiella sp. TaxID=1964365 RepID=UPI0039E260A2
MKILIADDHPLYRMALSGLLSQLDAKTDIVDCNDFNELQAEMLNAADLPDLIVLDIQMPGASFQDALKKLKRDHPSIPVVVVSASEEIGDMTESLRLGAHGYIPKSSTREVLVSAIRLVLSGGKYIPSQAFNLPDTKVAANTGRRSKQVSEQSQATQHLTRRQKNVLELMAQGQSNKEIAAGLNLAESTVKVHITAIFRTLGVSNRTQAVLQAREIA